MFCCKRKIGWREEAEESRVMFCCKRKIGWREEAEE